MNHRSETVRILRTVLALVAGNALYSLTVVLFLIPSGLITGGATGIALAANRLIGLPVSHITLDLPETARTFSERYGAVLVMKDARTLVAEGRRTEWPERDAALSAIAAAFALTGEDPYETVKALQAAFDPAGLRFSEEYYDVLGLEPPPPAQ